MHTVQVVISMTTKKGKEFKIKHIHIVMHITEKSPLSSKPLFLINHMFKQLKCY